MLQQLGQRQSCNPSNRRDSTRPQRAFRQLLIESLEPRQMLAASAISTSGLTFHVVDDATKDYSYQYALNGSAQGSTTLAAPNSAPRGVTSTITGDKTWVIDTNRNVYVYNAAGSLLGSWTAGSMAGNATPQGVATDGNDIWIVDSKSDQVFRYAGAASRLSGSQTASSSFALNNSNSNPTDIVTDGVYLWAIDDGKTTDRVFKYSLSGSLHGSWTLDAANKAPTGITFDPANVHDMWIADSGSGRVHQYVGAASRTTGSQAATTSIALATSDKNPQGVTLLHPPFAETPFTMGWVRQFGSTGDDHPRGGSIDSADNFYISGQTTSSLAAPNPGGDMSPFLAKYDGNGNPVWLEQPPPITGANYSGLGAAGNGSANVYQVISPERVNSTGNFLAGASLNNYDPNGTLLWSTPLPIGEDVIAVAIDDAGYAYMESYDSLIHLRKFDPQTGSVVWERTLDTGGASNSSSVAVDHLGHVYVVGYTYGSLIGPNAGLADGFLAKYDDFSNLLWSREFGTAGYDFAFSVQADSLGNVFVGGGVYASQDAWNSGDQDTFYTKFDAAGNLQWTRQLATTGNDQPGAPSLDGAGNFYFSVSSKGALGGPNKGDFDVVIGKYTGAGDLQWIEQIGTSGKDVAGFKGDGLGNLYGIGYTTGSWGGPNAGGEDAVLLKLSTPGASNASSSQSLLSLDRSASSTTTNRTSPQNSVVSAAANIQSSTDTGQSLSLLLAIHKCEMSKPTASQFSASCQAIDAAFTQAIGKKWSNILDEVIV
jgi:hypothetical protein